MQIKCAAQIYSHCALACSISACAPLVVSRSALERVARNVSSRLRTSCTQNDHRRPLYDTCMGLSVMGGELLQRRQRKVEGNAIKKRTCYPIHGQLSKSWIWEHIPGN